MKVSKFDLFSICSLIFTIGVAVGVILCFSFAGERLQIKDTSADAKIIVKTEKEDGLLPDRFVWANRSDGQG